MAGKCGFCYNITMIVIHFFVPAYRSRREKALPRPWAGSPSGLLREEHLHK